MHDEIEKFCLIFFAFILGLPSALPAQMMPQRPSKKFPVVHVPFLGCASDGQVGPLAAPKGIEKVVQVDARAAQRLAYYRAEYPPGVLAPQGWYCFGVYGSNGSIVFVSPQPIKTADLFSTTSVGFTGPAIQGSYRNGDTSGRFEVAQVMARVFPAQKAFVQRVIDEGIEPASDFPFGPFPKDKLILQSDRIVEYQTPPHSEGLGTLSRLRANDLPINGVEILQGDTPNLVSIRVRLPPDMIDLTSPIIHQSEIDNPAVFPKAHPRPH
jgi:hypothetical protein